MHFAFILVYIFMGVISKGDGVEPLSRHKREVRYCKDKFKILRTHTACRAPSPLVKSAGVTPSDITVILDEHNKYRAAVTPPAANMLKLYWDDEVAEIAQAWAETCSFNHDENKDRNIPGGYSMGQNIGQGYTSWVASIKAWHSEVKDFQYGKTVQFEKVGHYTQLVWASTSKVGCGFANCGTDNFYVCNYTPGGNSGPLNKPYKQGGASCEDCASNCNSKLCDCSNKVCENEGTLHPGNCSCSCKNSGFQIQPSCKLDCTKVKEPYMCGTGSYNRAGCQAFSSSVPASCPNTCGICPYAGYNYKEQNITVENTASRPTDKTLITLVICAAILHFFL